MILALGGCPATTDTDCTQCEGSGDGSGGPQPTPEDPCLGNPEAPGCTDQTLADSDGDGTPDDFDAFPDDNTETTDSDGDGVPAYSPVERSEPVALVLRPRYRWRCRNRMSKN